MLLALKMEGGTEDCRGPLEAGREGLVSLLGPPEEISPADILTAGQGDRFPFLMSRTLR